MNGLLQTLGLSAVIAGLACAATARGACLDLSAASDYVTVADDDSLDIGTSDLTIEAWVKTTQTATYRRVVSKGHYSTTGGYLFDISNGKLLAGINDSTNGLQGYFGEVPSPAVNDGQWHHVAVVFNRADTVGPLAYIDGTPYRMTTLGGNWATDQSGDLSNTNNLRLGMRDSSITEAYDGLLDDVRIWTEARTPREIRQSLLGQVAPGTPNLSASWNFEGTLADGSPNGNGGTWHTGNNAQATYSADSPTFAAPAAPIAQWQFGEAEDISYDLSSTPTASNVTNHWSGNTLKMNQPETVNAKGSDNRVLKEIGSTSFAACTAGNTELDLTGAVSIFARVKAGQFNGIDDIARADVSATQNQYALEFNEGVPQFRVRGVSDTADTILAFDRAVSAGTWYDLVGVFEPQGSSGTLYLSVYESETATRLGTVEQAVAFSSLIDLPAGAYFHIFESPDNANGNNIGFELEQLAVWNVPLSDWEIAALTVPEPDTLLLVVLGGLGVVVGWTRRGQARGRNK